MTSSGSVCLHLNKISICMCSHFSLCISKTDFLEFPDGLVVKDPALSLLWLGFNPWPGSFHMLQESGRAFTGFPSKKKIFF